jgi:hypothetical protein
VLPRRGAYDKHAANLQISLGATAVEFAWGAPRVKHLDTGARVRKRNLNKWKKCVCMRQHLKSGAWAVRARRGRRLLDHPNYALNRQKATRQFIVYSLFTLSQERETRVYTSWVVGATPYMLFRLLISGGGARFLFFQCTESQTLALLITSDVRSYKRVHKETDRRNKASAT